ncbi:site-specific integrase [Treponema sp.]|uniref:tyrosine-type recombinase/integrase n=1 Tax=Treponema sp. TaxID=166 RepID=UPI0025D6EE81|nr:site-specific integrase [Treponema sp.]MBR4323214.1 site-specific integrase [Treponema sp.]
MHYNVLRRSIKTKNKSVYRWYYSYIDPESGIKKQKVIPECKSRAEAYAFISTLPDLDRKTVLIKDIAKDMFIPGSSHVERLSEHGRKLTFETLQRHRGLLDKIVSAFGEMELKDLTPAIVDNHLRSLENRSGGWKNSFLETLSYIYKEAPFCGCEGLIKPNFMRFSRNTKKADIFTTEELNRFFDKELWENSRDHLIFLCIASFGLRLGEARALQLRQFIFDKNAVVIDGFCKRNGERTNYNKKGSNEDKKWRVAVAPDTTMQLVYNYSFLNQIQADEFVFVKEGKLPVRNEYLEDVFERQLTKAGIEKNGRKLVPHSLRFTYVTRMRRDLPAEIVQKIVGHTSIEMTEYYTRAAIPEMVAAIQNAIPAVNGLFE